MEILAENAVLAGSNSDQEQQQFVNEISSEISGNISGYISDRISNAVPNSYPIKTASVNSQKFTEQQTTSVNIKTRAYVRNGNMVLNSVRESDLHRQKLFGKLGFADVKSGLNGNGKSEVKGGLDGVKEKNTAEKSYWGVQKAAGAISGIRLKNNAIGYFGKDNNQAKYKSIKRLTIRFIPKNAKEMLAAVMGLESVLAVA